MRKYFDTVLSTSGRLLAGAQVRVLTYPAGVLASIYSDSAGTVPADNPIRTDLWGRFQFYVADGRYSLNVQHAGVFLYQIDDVLISESGSATGAWTFSDVDPVSTQGTTGSVWFNRTNGTIWERQSNGWTVQATVNTGTNNPNPNVVTTMTVVQGDNQSATVSTAVGLVPTVCVKDDGVAVGAGRPVSFTVASGGGVVIGGSAVTDANGYASPQSWTLGAAAGTNTLQAYTANASVLTFTATAVAVARVPTTLTVLSGTGQSGTVSTALASVFSLKVFDQFGSPLQNAQVDCIPPSGGSSVPTSALSDAQGIVNFVGTLNASPGTQTFTFRLAANIGVSQTITATANVAAPPTPPTVVTDGAWMPLEQWSTIGVNTSGQVVNPGTGAVTSFAVTTTLATNVYPFMVGIGLPQSDTLGASSIVCDADNWDVTVLRRWNNGNIKHAVICGRANMPQNIARTITVSRGTPPTRTALTRSALETAVGTANKNKVTCGALGSAVDLSSILASGYVRTWIANAEMIECHYRADVGGGTLLAVFFHVRYFADGRVWVRAIVENGYLDNGAGAVATNVDNSYVPTVLIAGSTVFTKTSPAITGITQINDGAYDGTRSYFHEVITAPGHGFLPGQAIYVSGVSGMTQANGQFLPVASVTTDTITTGQRILNNPGWSAYTSGGTVAFSHCANTRWSVEGWINTDGTLWNSGLGPDAKPTQNVADLKAAKLVPNYYWSNPSAASLNALTQTYTPMARGDTPAGMSAGGAAGHISLLPDWNAKLLAAGDSRAYKSTLANSSYLNSRAICFRDATTKDIVKPSAFSTWSLYGNGIAGGRETNTSAGLQWEINHHPGEGYLAYLLTGDYWHYETMLLQFSLMWALRGNTTTDPVVAGDGTSRKIVHETRGMAWALRSMAQVCALMPDARLTPGTIETEYRTVLDSNISYWNTIATNPSVNQLGVLYEYGPGGVISTYGDGWMSDWQQAWVIQSIGFGSDIEPLASMTQYNTIRAFVYKLIVGMLGDATGFWYGWATTYRIKVAGSGSSNDPITGSWYTTFSQIYTDTFAALSGGAASLAKQNTLANGGDMFGVPPPTNSGSGGPADAYFGRWGYLLPAIAYAVDHGAAGAQAAWNRIVNSVAGTGAMATYGSSFASTLGNSATWSDFSQWGIPPRSYSALPYTLPASGQFVNISSNYMKDVDPCPARDCPYSNGGLRTIFEVWTGGVYTPDYGTYGAVLVHGGGHNSYDGNEAYAVDLNTGTWKRIGTPSLYGEASEAFPSHMYPDGQPGVPHTYKSLSYMPASWGGGAYGSLIHFGHAGGGGTQYIRKRALHPSEDQSWTVLGSGQNLSDLSPTQDYFQATIDTSRQGWWVTSGVGNMHFVSKTGAITKYTSFINANRLDCVIEYCPLYDGVLFAGEAPGGGIYLAWFDCTQPNAGWTTITTSGTAPSPISGNTAGLSASKGGMAWSTLLGCFAHYQGMGSSTVYKLTPPSNPKTGTWVWSSETLTGAGGISPSVSLGYLSGTAHTNGHWGRFREVPSLRSFVWVDGSGDTNGSNNAVQLWRLTGM